LRDIKLKDYENDIQVWNDEAKYDFEFMDVTVFHKPSTFLSDDLVDWVPFSSNLTMIEYQEKSSHYLMEEFQDKYPAYNPVFYSSIFT